MTWEERFEFLRQSIESHDRQIGELTDKIAETSAQIKEMDRLMREGWARTDLNLRSGHVGHQASHVAQLTHAGCCIA